MRGLLVAAVIAAIATGGCEADVVPYTQVDVELVADPMTTDGAERLVLRIQSGRFGPIAHQETIMVPSFPVVVPVAPRNDEDPSRFTIVAELYGSIADSRDTRIGLVRGIIDYVPNERRSVLLAFVHGCALGTPRVFSTCGDLETCVAGECIDACITPAPEGQPQQHFVCRRPGPGDECAGTDPAVRESQMFCLDDRCLCREPRGSVCYAADVAQGCCDVAQCPAAGEAGGCLLAPAEIISDMPHCPEETCACEVGAQFFCVPPQQAEACCDTAPECRRLTEAR